MTKDLFYKIISRVLDPLVLTPLIFILVSHLFELSLYHILIFLVIQIVIPIIYFIIGLRLGKYDIDLTDRTKRIPILLVVLFTQLITLFLLDAWKYTEVVKIQGLLLVINGIFLLITTKWKISGHALGNTLFTIALGIYVHPALFLLGFILIPLVGKARIHLHKHTLKQLIAGTALGLLFLLLYL